MTNSAIDLNLLRIFEAVFNERSVTRAAQRLGLSQPAVSGAINRMSQQIGEPLFRRARGGVEPTPRAERLIGPVRESLHAMTTTLTMAEGAVTSKSPRRFRIGMFNMLEPLLLPAVLNEIQGEDLDVVLDIVSLYAVDAASDLLAGTLDIIFNLGPLADDEIVSHHLGPTRFVCVTREGWSETHGPLTAESFAKASFVQLARPNPMTVSKPFADILHRIPKAQFKFSVTKGWSVPNLVATTDLVALLPRAFARIVAPSFGLEIHPLPFETDLPHVFMSWHQRSNDDALHGRLRAMYLRALQDQIMQAMGESDERAA